MWEMSPMLSRSRVLFKMHESCISWRKERNSSRLGRRFFQVTYFWYSDKRKVRWRKIRWDLQLNRSGKRHTNNVKGTTNDDAVVSGLRCLLQGFLQFPFGVLRLLLALSLIGFRGCFTLPVARYCKCFSNSRLTVNHRETAIRFLSEATFHFT